MNHYYIFLGKFWFITIFHFRVIILSQNYVFHINFQSLWFDSHSHICLFIMSQFLNSHKWSVLAIVIAVTCWWPLCTTDEPVVFYVQLMLLYFCDIRIHDVNYFFFLPSKYHNIILVTWYPNLSCKYFHVWTFTS